MAAGNTLGPGERLKREKDIEALFRDGKALSVFPLRVLWRIVPIRAEALFPVRAGFSASKKKFRRAVDRNRIKRLLRECWRTQKMPCYGNVASGTQLHLFFIFTATELPEYAVLMQAMQKAVIRLVAAIALAEAGIATGGNSEK